MSKTLRCFSRAIGTRPVCFIHWTKVGFRAAPSIDGMVLADDPVLGMLNTLATIDGVPWDFWQVCGFMIGPRRTNVAGAVWRCAVTV
nr:hypothetical protein [Pseudomonas sp. IB20]